MRLCHHLAHSQPRLSVSSYAYLLFIQEQQLRSIMAEGIWVGYAISTLSSLDGGGKCRQIWSRELAVCTDASFGNKRRMLTLQSYFCVIWVACITG